MKNIVFDFGDVFLKIGDFGDTVSKILAKKDAEIFSKKYQKEIKNSFIDNSIDIYKIIENEYKDAGITKEQILEISCKTPNDFLLSQVPILAKNYKIYMLSNISSKDFIPYFLKKYKLEQYFTGRVESCNVGCLKPNDEIYEYLLSEYKLDPKETVFFDDRQKNIEAAEKNGITGVLFDDFEIDIEEKIKKL